MRCCYVDAEESKVSQATARPPQGPCDPGRGAVVRRLWSPGARTRLGHGAPDRGGPCCDDAPRETRRKIWIRVFPDKPITKKPSETRMGKGKGAPEEWVCVVKPARILYEMEGVTEDVAREAMRLAAHKLPIKTRFVARGQVR